MSYFREGSVPIKVLWMKQSALNFHDHPFHELVVVFNGQGMHYTTGEEYRISAGDVFLIKPGTAHGYGNTDELEIVNILYLPEQLKLPLYDLRDLPGYHAFFEVEPAMRSLHGFKSHLNVGMEKLQYLRKQVRYLEEESRPDTRGGLFMAASYLMQIFGFISRSYLRPESQSQTEIIRLGNVIAYLQRNYQRELTLDDMARKASVSRTTLYRLFRQAFGISPVNYLISIRLSHAQEMLELGNSSISDIALETGFSDSNYFSRQFRKHNGMSPRQYRDSFARK